MEYKIDEGFGNYIIIEPLKESTILVTDELSKIFKILHIGSNMDIPDKLKIGDLILVAPNSIEKLNIWNPPVYFIRESDVIAKISIKT